HSGDLLVTAEPIIDPRAFGTSRIHILDWRGKKERVPSGPISLWGVIAGISKYSDEDLKLRFAASDAEDFFKALTLAGDNLFGASNVHLRLLTSSGNNSAIVPSRNNLKKA